MPNARVLVSLLTDQEEFQRLQAEDAKATAAVHGLDVEVLFAENNGVVQIQQLFRAVHAAAEERPTAIIVETVTGEGLERVARGAVKAGVGWILLNRRVPYLASLAQGSKSPVSSVGTDQMEVGRIQGRQFRTLLPKGGPDPWLVSAADRLISRCKNEVPSKRLEACVLSSTAMDQVEKCVW